MSVYKQFAKYVSQNILGMLGISCYIIADTFFISKAAGANGITVLNLVLPIYNLIFAIGSMVGVGSATRFAILRARNEEAADDYFSNGIFWVCIFSILFILGGIFLPDKILMLMGADEVIVSLGIGYTRIFLLFSPFFMMNYIFSAFVRNDHDPSLAMVATVAGSLSNIVFDYVFMFVFGWGLEGAAAATAASPIISIAICLIHFVKKSNTIRFRIKKPDFRKLTESVPLGVPAFIGELSSGVTTTIFNFLILGIAGNIGVAAYGVIANFALVAMSIFNGISQGSQPLISNYYGKGERRSAEKVLKLGMMTSLAAACVLFLIVYGFTGQLVSLFNSENSRELAEYAFTGMRLYFTGFFFAGLNIAGCGYLSATEQARPAFVASLLRGVIAIALCSVILAAVLGMNGVWMSFAAAEMITLFVTMFFCFVKPRRLRHE